MSPPAGYSLRRYVCSTLECSDQRNDTGLQPPAAGQKRKKEEWENLWYYGMYGSMGLATVLLYYKPDTR